MKEGWALRNLGEVCDNLDSKRVPITKNKRISGEIPYYGASGIVDYVADYLFDEDLLLVSEDGANLLARTYPIAFSISGKNWVNNHAHVLRFNNINSQRFIEYYLNSIKLDNYVSGMAQPKLNQKSLNSIIVPFPPLPEQKQIVAILDKAFAVITQAQANIEKNIENAKDLFQSKLNEIFSQPARPSGGKGDGWEEKSLGELGKVSMCKRILKKQTNTESGIPFYKIGTFGKTANAFISEEIYNEFKVKYSFPKKGDVLLSASGTIGRRVIYDGKPAYFQDSNIVWIANNEEEVLNEFLYEFYGFCDWNPSRGATISRLYNDDLRRIKITYPKKETQKIIVKEINELFRNTEIIESHYEQKLTSLEDLKKSILQKAFAGALTQSVQEEELSSEQKHALLITLAYSRHRNAGTELTFGHTKSEKMIHLFENYANIDLNRSPVKDAAGPNHFEKVVNVIEPLAKKEKYFSITKEDKRYTYGFAPNSFNGIKKLESQLDPLQKRKVEEIISLFLMETTEQSELFATVFAGWNNLILRGEEINDESIVYEARENWHPNKLKIERSKFFETITKLRTSNIIPEGKGKLVEKKTLF